MRRPDDALARELSPPQAEPVPLLALMRRDPADDGLAREAAERGAEVHRFLLFATKHGAHVDDLLAWLPDAGSDSAIAWTSRRAASVLVESALPERRGALERIPLFAVGRESAAPAVEAGLSVSTPSGGLGASHLASHLIERAHEAGIRRVAFLHGDRALPDFPESLARGGIRVERFELYRTVFQAADTAPLERALDALRPCVAVFFSPSGIAGLERLLEPMTAAACHQQALAIGRGETTYHALLRWGYERAMRPTGAACASFDEFVLDALSSAARSLR